MFSPRGKSSKSLAIAFFVIILITSCNGVPESRVSSSAMQQIATNLLVNPDFEDATTWTRACHWQGEGGALDCVSRFQEVRPPTGWTAWWGEGIICEGGWLTGRPEFTIVTRVTDASRIYTGNQAAKQFTFYRCHLMGLAQTVAVEAGESYVFTVYAHAWYSRCSSRPHDVPYEADCSTPIGWASDWISIGLDPMGGNDPRAASVIWSNKITIYGRYSTRLAVTGQAEANQMTVFIRFETTHPLKHCDGYADTARMWKAWQVFLPMITR
jgi:hypothetical protein